MLHALRGDAGLAPVTVQVVGTKSLREAYGTLYAVGGPDIGWRTGVPPH